MRFSLGAAATGRSTGRATATRSCGSRPTEPLYWKARNLERRSTARAWATRSPLDRRRPTDDRPAARTGARGRRGRATIQVVDPAHARPPTSIGAGTTMTVERRDPRRRPVGRARAAGTRPGDLRRGDSYTRRGLRPRADAGAARGRRRSGATRPARRGPASSPCRSRPATPASRLAVGRRRPRARTLDDARRPLPRRTATSGDADRRLPGCASASVRRRQGDAARSHYARTWGLAKRCSSAARRRRTTTSLAVNALPAQARFTLHRAPGRRPRRTRAARRLPVRHQGGLLPALLGRDGAAAAHGRHPRARGDRLPPRRLLDAQRRLDRARHRRARVGRGVVRRARLGDVRPDARRHARALADRGAPAARRRRRHRAASRRGAPARAAGAPRRGATRVRPDVLLRPSATTAGGATTPPTRRRRPAASGGGCAHRRRPAAVLGAPAVLVVRAPRAARGRDGRSTARSSSSRRRCGAPGARCRPARRCASSSSARRLGRGARPTCAR